MLFQSQIFILVFLPSALAGYFAVARSVRARQFALIVASLVFYAWWDIRFVPLVLGQIFITWGFAWLDARRRT